MSLGAIGLKTKKQLKELVGKRLSGHYVETSLFGQEYPKNGTGTVTIVGPDAYIDRKWYASVILENHIVKKVS